MTQIHDLLGLERIHLEMRGGTEPDAFDYCRKGEQSKEEWDSLGTRGPNFGRNADFYVFGKFHNTRKGQRNDLQEFYKHVKAGLNDRDLAEINFSAFARCLKAIDRLRMQMRPEEKDKRMIVLLQGSPGLGKTRWAFDTYPDLFELAIGNDLWFDGYAGEEVVLLDEFEGEISLNNALKILDPHYVRKVPVKGGFTWWNPKLIICTSNQHPSKWYKWKGREVKEEALRDRFIRSGGWIMTGVAGELVKVDIKKYWPLDCDVLGNAHSINEALMPVAPLNSNGSALFRYAVDPLTSQRSFRTHCTQGHLLDEEGYGIVDGCCAEIQWFI